MMTEQTRHIAVVMSAVDDKAGHWINVRKSEIGRKRETEKKKNKRQGVRTTKNAQLETAL